MGSEVLLRRSPEKDTHTEMRVSCLFGATDGHEKSKGSMLYRIKPSS